MGTYMKVLSRFWLQPCGRIPTFRKATMPPFGKVKLFYAKNYVMKVYWGAELVTG
jgi:hypothetical protein